MEPGVTLPRVYAVEVRHRPAQQENEGLWTRISSLVSRTCPTFVDQGGHVGGRGLVRGYGTHERFMEGEVPTGYSRGRL